MTATNTTQDFTGFASLISDDCTHGFLFRVIDTDEELEELKGIYSDYHKEIFGHRPHTQMEYILSLDKIDFAVEFQCLSNFGDEMIEHERRCQEEHKAFMRRLISQIVSCGASCNKEAKRWIGMADNLEEVVVEPMPFSSPRYERIFSMYEEGYA